MNRDADFDFNAIGLRKALGTLRAAFGSPQDSTNNAQARMDGLPAHLPATGMGSMAALERMSGPMLHGARALRSPGFIAHMDPPTPWMTWAATQWTASMNQNLLHPDTSPLARDIERVTVSWIADLFGMDGGHMVPGSSVANLTALWAARETGRVDEVVCSTTAHLSIQKAAHLLGLPCRLVPCHPDQTIDTTQLGDVRRAALVLTAGTVAAGAIDPLNTGADAAWRHVDAAWAGPLRFSGQHAHLLDGVEDADSVSLSAHKWLFQPKESALVLFSDATSAHESISFGGGYLAVPNIGVQGSHGATAAPLLVTLLAWGRDGVGQRIDRCMEAASELCALVSEREEILELRSPHTTGVVLWRPRALAASDVRAQLPSAYASLTDIDHQQWFRSVAANPNAQPHLLVNETIEVLNAYCGER